MARRLTVVLVGAAMAALVLGVAGAAWAQEPLPCTGQVVLDPGHGGNDSGATYTFADGTKLREKDEVLTVANRLKGLLEADGLAVCMTRGGGFDGDATLSNNDRYTYANTTGARILVSIHMNGSSDPNVDYTTTLFGKWQKDKALAYAIYGDLVANPPYGLVTLPAAKLDDPNKLLDGRKPYSFASGVLLKSNMPATIAETVFITNSQEAKWLKTGTSPDGTQVSRHLQIAQKLEEGILTYLQAH